MVSRSLDPRNRGYIQESDFIECLRVHLGVDHHDNKVGELLPRLKHGEWVAYPTFLAMFEQKGGSGSTHTRLQSDPTEDEVTPPPSVSLEDVGCVCIVNSDVRSKFMVFS